MVRPGRAPMPINVWIVAHVGRWGRTDCFPVADESYDGSEIMTVVLKVVKETTLNAVKAAGGSTPATPTVPTATVPPAAAKDDEEDESEEDDEEEDDEEDEEGAEDEEKAEAAADGAKPEVSEPAVAAGDSAAEPAAPAVVPNPLLDTVTADEDPRFTAPATTTSTPGAAFKDPLAGACLAVFGRDNKAFGGARLTTTRPSARWLGCRMGRRCGRGGRAPLPGGAAAAARASAGCQHGAHRVQRCGAR